MTGTDTSAQVAYPQAPNDAVQYPQEPSTRVRKINFTVFGCLVVFFFLYYVDVFLVVVPWLSYSVPGVTNIGVLSMTAGSALYCYLLCVFKDPGSVPEGWQPDEENGGMKVMEVKRKGGARVCAKCDKPKPARTHHCRVCRRCVLRMDHHCPWTNNCIGHANYRAFLLFLIYVVAALVHTLGLLVSHTLHTLNTSRAQLVLRTGPQGVPVELDDGLKSIWLYALLQTVAFALALPLTVGLSFLLAYHCHLTLTNKTTIEYQEGVSAHFAALGGGPAVGDHPYDLGPCANLHEVCGDNPGVWPLPPCGACCGGSGAIE
eukprot:CAMPEP_0202874016 /NCGR_PEP_ID=MMETSP1391-20130828/24525_1 /ASSEMBLY_ACC=CAM_ASM_000867 /TAXON_ID=1034604 /ORGANISM="Chlamydomonas leiostraca, Strain SAG 11-49" /LENGTH=316 /DNA_ID=CAMNT_0049555353 /DNA_START=59 /DNA_END=1006 /DNA_ORIENTATION=+